MQVTPSIQLTEPIGHGAMGTVWRAYHSGLEAEVAVKLIATDVVEREVLLDRFRREAALTARIKSPHVTQVFDHGKTADGIPYIVMELLHGETLEERIAREGELSVRDAVLLVTQLSEVLTRAHDLGVVHRDIKPSNVMLIESGYELFAKLLDFGIAKEEDHMPADDLTRAGEVMGSPLYMSPEQFADPKAVDHRADLWSLAVMTFEALTGALCFDGETLPQVMRAALRRERYAVADLRSDLVGDYDAFFDMALDPDPEARFHDARSFARAFARAALEDTAPRASRLAHQRDERRDEIAAEDRSAQEVPLRASEDDDEVFVIPTQRRAWKAIGLLVGAGAVVAAGMVLQRDEPLVPPYDEAAAPARAGVVTTVELEPPALPEIETEPEAQPTEAEEKASARAKREAAQPVRGAPPPVRRAAKPTAEKPEEPVPPEPKAEPEVDDTPEPSEPPPAPATPKDIYEELREPDVYEHLDRKEDIYTEETLDH